MDELGGGGYEVKKGFYGLNEVNGDGPGLNSETPLINQPPHLRNIWRIVFLVMVVLALLSLGYMIRSFCSAPYADSGMNDLCNVLPILFRDLKDEGLIKKGNKGFVLGANIEGDLELLRGSGIDLLMGADLRERKANERSQVFDFVFVPSFEVIQLIDGMLKEGSLVILPLGHDPSDELRLLKNFKIVYLRRFESTLVGMRRVRESSNGMACMDGEQVSGSVTPDKKRAALKGLENVYFEPPRWAKKSSFTSRKIKFLPNLLKDSLDEYPRRIFISDDSSSLDWFYKNYPMRDQEFEVYNLETGVKTGQISKFQGMSISSWMKKNARHEDYVVMKAEAQAVEEMLDGKALHLVDELFMECKNQWEDGGETRAYWQCLALYGKVTDEGIAVHQWWN